MQKFKIVRKPPLAKKYVHGRKEKNLNNFWAFENFKILGKPLLGEKYVEGKKERKQERRRKNNAKFSGRYVRPACTTFAPNVFNPVW